MKLLSHGPEPCASANSAIPAQHRYNTIIGDYCQGFFETCLLCLKICKKLQIRYIISDIIIDDDVINPKVMIMKARKENNKGFTLVELIVVLVILAILAAVLVPALLGYIDDARTKEDLIWARNAINATQAKVAEYYAFRLEGQGAGEYIDGNHQNGPTIIPGFYGDNDNGDCDASKTDFAKGILADLDEDPYILIVGLGRRSKYEKTEPRKSYTVYIAMYMRTKDSKPIFYDGEQWTTKYPEKDKRDPEAVFKPKDNQMKKNDVFVQYYAITNKCGKSMTGGVRNSVWNFLRQKSGSKYAQY